MSYKEIIKNVVLKGLYIGIIYSALGIVLPYIVFRLVSYRLANFVLITVLQILAVAISYGFVDITINQWQTSRRTKAIVISLSILMAVGVIVYNLASLFAMSA